MTVKRDRYGDVIQAARPSICQNVTVGAASTNSAAFVIGTVGLYGDGAVAGGSGAMVTPATTQHVRVVSSTDCYIVFGPAATVIATSASCFLPANSPEYFWVNPGDVVAVIQSSAAGVLNVCECA
jgi:hypothetical protein